jgi:hypothetical protein
MCSDKDILQLRSVSYYRNVCDLQFQLWATNVRYSHRDAIFIKSYRITVFSGLQNWRFFYKVCDVILAWFFVSDLPTTWNEMLAIFICFYFLFNYLFIYFFAISFIIANNAKIRLPLQKSYTVFIDDMLWFYQ